MLGIIGFGAAAAIIGMYAISLPKMYHRVDASITQKIATGFGLLSLTMIVWQFVVGLGLDGQDLQVTLVAANILLLAGSAQMLSVITRSALATILFWAAGAILILLRLTTYPSEAVVVDGLLFFHLTNFALLIFALLFSLIWLPASLKFAKHVAVAYPKTPQLNSLLYWLYVLLVIVCGLFMATQRSYTVIVSFVCIVTLFLSLLVVGQLHLQSSVSTKKEKEHAKR